MTVMYERMNAECCRPTGRLVLIIPIAQQAQCDSEVINEQKLFPIDMVI